MKKFFVFLILALVPIFCFAQIRDKVCIVYQTLYDQTVEDLHAFVPRLTKLGVENADDEINKFIEKGCFGSGFIYVAPDGKNYVVTNRHVVEDSQSLHVVFMDENDEIIHDYSGLKIFAVDPDIDICMLSFPEGENPFTEGFEFEEKRLSDGENVYTAGYPGLLGDASWQFGSGIITNSRVKVADLIDPEISTVIQHSAQIDPGNSGGPLFIKDENGNYKIVGVNTWKISNRQDTNFSVPISVVNKFLTAAVNNTLVEKDPAEEIMKKSLELQKMLNKFTGTYEEFFPYISCDYISNEGKAIFDKVVKGIDIKTSNLLLDIFKNYSPLEGMRYSIAYYMFREYHKDEFKKSVEQKMSVSEDKLPEIAPAERYEGTDIWYTSLYLNYTHRFVKIEWIKSKGVWQIYSYKNVSYKEAGTQNQINKTGTAHKENKHQIPEGKGTELGKATLYYPGTVSIGVQIPELSNNITNHYNIDTEIKLSNIVLLDFAVDAEENKVHIMHEGEFPEIIHAGTAYIGAQFQLPFWKNVCVLCPYVTVQAGFGIDDFGAMAASIKARAEAGFRCNILYGKKNSSMYVEAQFDVTSSLYSFGVENAKFGFDPQMGLGYSVGFAF